MALVTGLTFGITQWISATFVSVELTDIIAIVQRWNARG